MLRFLTISLLFCLILTPVNAGIRIKKLADLESELSESSGLEYYMNKYLITHNDSGNKAIIYVINEHGKILKEIEIKDADNDDWEDLTCSADGTLYIGDIGNNENKREKCQIYVVKSDFFKTKDGDVKSDKITFEYEDQQEFPPAKAELHYDAEAIFWMKDSIYILTKCRSEPFSGRSFVYVLPDKPGKYKARKIGEIPFCSLSWMFCSVTSADYDPKSNTLVVLLYGKIIFISDFPGNRFWEGKFESHTIWNIKQREAITFIDANNLYMSDEYSKKVGGGNLYKVTRR
ncbi:MAG: hypothetical protein HUJ25_04385 [Crocinitomicaceae bacterium]|nr:hypothetical protein [Crocinitomicaceae bacterium]